ncbi:MAG TPA: LysR family transcriptional regulator [Candidatus Bathyarchaeia archaeon]|nr:LysR family transcriptional regulator [Candidatus Bathyarchaeia archaeon]
MSLNPAHLRTLHEISRLGSFSRAAEALRLSQPAVSLHVRQLEQALGTRLLERVGRRAEPTRAGALLLEHAGRALEALDAAAASVHALRGVVAGRVRVGTGATASIYLLPQILRRLRARYPEVELVIVTGNTTEIAKAVAENALDLGVVTLPVRPHQLLVAPFYTDRLVGITPRNWTWRRRSRSRGRRRALTPADLAAEPLILYERGGTIRQIIESWFKRGRVTPRVSMELGNGEAIKELVSAGLGPSITSWASVRAEARSKALRVFPLSPPLSRRLGIIRRRDKPETPALWALLRALARGTGGRRRVS